MARASSAERPAGVPARAWWSPADNEWVLGPKDDAGELHGEVHYWRADGTLCCISMLSHGKPHGPFQRFHETGEVAQTGQFEHGELHGLRSFFVASGPTTEDMHGGGRLSREIVRSEYEYAHGQLSSVRHFGRDNAQLRTDGKPLPSRPSGVPEAAFHNAKTGNWVVGGWDGEGLLEVYAADGYKLAIESYRANLAHGPSTLFFPDGSKRAVINHADGKLDGVTEQYHRSGGLARRAHFRAGAWAGTLSDWAPSGELIAESSIAPPKPIAAVAEPAQAQLCCEPEADAIAELSMGSISAAGMACLIAIGWGGNQERDAKLARVARRVVRETDDDALVEALHRTGLDTAPRLMTATRAERVLEAMGPVAAVDTHALRSALAQRGGAGGSVLLTCDDAAGVAALRERIRDNRLDLGRQALARLPQAIRQFPELYELDARYNHIAEVGPELAELLFLRKLSLSHNRITSLPDELARLRDLQELMLGANPMTTLPAVISELAELESLSLGGTALESLPASFGRLERLRSLWLEDTALHGLPESFAGLRELSFLHLGDHGWSTPPAVIYELPALRELWIASPNLQHLPEDIGRLHKLERLVIWYSRLTALPDALFELTSLRELRVRDNPLPRDTRDRLKEALPDCTIY